MAKDFMAQMLDELMGRNRNAAPNERQEMSWEDETVCKHHLVKYCPHELFLNTKADMGICKLLHDDNFKEQYQNSPKKGKMGYEEEFLRFIRQMVQDVDRRIDRGKGRLESTRQAAQTENMHAKNDERLRELSEKIDALVQEAGKLGAEGKVEEAQQKLRQSDQLRKDRDGLRQTIEMAIQQEKQLEVCQTCGAFLIVGDAQQRIDDHLAGKQHMGYARIKETLKEEEEKIRAELEERRKSRSSRGGSRERSERGDRSDRDDRRSRRDRSRERSKRRSPSRERSKRHRSRGESSDRRVRRRSRSRESRHRRDRSRERANGRESGRRDRSVS
ncbi:hypothetical protein RvY_16007-1 [Ramazzottius varieornatus]|uniref:Uncharacterized protein n=1 Tax=Ramazzottius varieornatus TaxID=947166 RepID=A0A1D1W1H4_RAMVA|nr:hypothetical protein RvY_16007-1 [Ramazzottius varieornatus]